MDRLSKRSNSGFTIVELVIVIVVIAIIAVITIVSYGSVVENAIKLSLTSDLVNASDQIKLYQSDHAGNLPTSIGCPSNDATGQLCVNATKDNEFVEYHADNSYYPKTFQISATHGEKYHYRIASNSNEPLPCPIGFIIIPGSKTYGTDDFCVMKYEAKRTDGNSANPGYTIPFAEGWGSSFIPVSQNQAIEYSKKVQYCGDACHLISDAEWLTIMQNVLSVGRNWCDKVSGKCELTGKSGVGLIFSGHSDVSPSASAAEKNPLAVCFDDSNGFCNTGNNINDLTVSKGMVGYSQRRTLYLSNGEVIWDLAGNMWEYTSGRAETGVAKPGKAGITVGDWVQWNDVTQSAGWTPNPSLAGTGLAGSNTWTMTSSGVGVLQSDITDSGQKPLVRGGSNTYNNNSGDSSETVSGTGGTGVATMSLFKDSVDDTSSWITFRVAR